MMCLRASAAQCKGSPLKAKAAVVMVKDVVLTKAASFTVVNFRCKDQLNLYTAVIFGNFKT